MKTRTGNFEIGWLRRNYAWEQDLDGIIAWAKANDINVIDIHRDAPTSAKTITDAGLQVGAADLLAWKSMISADKGKRAEAVAQNAEYIKDSVAAGAKHFFLVMQAEDPSLPRDENFGYMVESFSELAPTFEEHDAVMVIEGWPGPGAWCVRRKLTARFSSRCHRKRWVSITTRRIWYVWASTRCASCVSLPTACITSTARTA